MKKSQIITFVSIIFGILILVHLVIYEAVLLVFPDLLGGASIILKAAIIILPLLFISSNVLAFWYNNYFSRFFYRVMAVWMGLTFYLFLASVVTAFTSFFPGLDLAIFGEILLAVAVLITFYGLIHSQNIKIIPVSIKLANLPESWNNRKFVFVSDLHLGQIRGQKFAVRVMGKINQLNPAAVFIGGDLYDGVMVDNLKIIEPLRILNRLWEFILSQVITMGLRKKPPKRT